MPYDLLTLGSSPFKFHELEPLGDADDRFSLTLHHTGLTSEERSRLEDDAYASDQA